MKHRPFILPEPGEVWEDEDGIRYLVRELHLIRRAPSADPSVIAFAILRVPGGGNRRVTPDQWKRMRSRCHLFRGASDDT